MFLCVGRWFLIASRSSHTWQIQTGLIQHFLDSLDDRELAKVFAVFDLLEERGPQLGRPIADRIRDSKHHNMKELRPPSSSLRILFAFDPRKQAILLIAGDKSGDWNKWYVKNIPLADKLYDDHLAQ